MTKKSQIKKETLKEQLRQALEKHWESFEQTLTLADKISETLQLFSEITEDAAKYIIDEELSKKKVADGSAFSSLFNFKSELNEHAKKAVLTLEFKRVSGKRDAEDSSNSKIVLSDAEALHTLEATLDSKNRNIDIRTRVGTQFWSSHGVWLQVDYSGTKDSDEKIKKCFEEVFLPWICSKIPHKDARNYLRALTASPTTPQIPSPS